MTESNKIILPKSFEVQLLDEHSNELKSKNILCQLNIFKNDNSYYTYSFIPTNNSGKIILTRKNLIFNTELKHEINQPKSNKSEPTKFEFFVIGNELITRMTKSIKSFIGRTENEIKEELNGLFSNQDQINKEVQKVKLIQSKDEKLYNLLKSNTNKGLIYSAEHSKIQSEWEKAIDYKYKLKLKNR